VQQIEGLHYRTGNAIRITHREGIISGVEELTGHWTDALPVIAPGLTDLQVNGYMGVDFNRPGLTPGQVKDTCRALLRAGVTTFWPTVITGPADRIGRNLGVLARAAGEDPFVASMIGGIHLEGPFISPEDGPRGAHPAAHCRLPDQQLLEQWQEEAGGLLKMVTLAPELEGAMDMIRTSSSQGMVVAIGHTGAGPGVIEEAAGAGATLSTHLGNGCHAVLPRHSNYLWDQLAEDRLHATMIADGFHLPDGVLKVFLRAKGDRAMLVSDCTEYAGLQAGEYDSPSTGRIVLTPRGKLHLKDQDGKLAGSASDLLDGVRKIAQLADLPTAWDMASVRPSRFTEPGSPAGLETGAPADFVLFGPEEGPPVIRSVAKNGIIYNENNTT